jgi:DNA repair protein RecO (recombination protein O)
MAAELARALGGIQAGERQPLPPDSRRAARELLNLFIAHHLGKRLKSVDFMSQVGVD